MGEPLITFDRVNIVFGSQPERALPLIDEGKNRAEIQEKTGQILGVAEASLEIAEGEVLVLMGLSGSGKSTLLRAINGLNPVIRGNVTVRCPGETTALNPHTCSRSQLRQLRLDWVSMVFQQFGLLPWRTVAENVGFGLEVAGVAKTSIEARVNEQLELVGLAEWKSKKVQELSGGMQQRVGLARAFVTQAPILLMDEPYSALDPLIRARLQDELIDLQERLRRTIVFVSHDLDEAIKIGTRIAIMEGGRIVQVGTPQDILNNPVNTYVRDFVAHMNPLAVLRVEDAMQSTKKAVKSIPEKRRIAYDMRLKDAMRLQLDIGGELYAMKKNRVVGKLDASDIQRALLRNDPAMNMEA